MATHPTIAVIGLGYVGLPLAVALSRHFPTVGFDIDETRVAQLRAGRDRTGEVDEAALRASHVLLTAIPAEMAAADIFIITVPTPVDRNNAPDLGAVLSACHIVAPLLKPGRIVVLESTVYPGVTEDVCGPTLERGSGLACGREFFLGYSPERANPGDREHTVERIAKVVAGQTPEVTDRLAHIYGTVTAGGIFRAASIKTAEAAKAIENTQRDINIAFINEVTMICARLGISVYDVLEAAATKWNFLNFRPGLVGGHCIGVDPYYLAQCALEAGLRPEVILAGRRINDRMGDFIADSIARALLKGKERQRDHKPVRVLVLGLTFKENVPDLRNSKVVDVIAGLRAWGCLVDVHDPLADPAEAKRHYDIAIEDRWELLSGYDCVVGAVPHRLYAEFTTADFHRLLTPGGLLADIKGMWRGRALPPGIERWEL